MKRIICIISKVNLPRIICTHLVGTCHTKRHRKITGLILMSAGVTIAHMTGQLGVKFVQFLGDGIGYGIHGIGLIPFIDSIDLPADKI